MNDKNIAGVFLQDPFPQKFQIFQPRNLSISYKETLKYPLSWIFEALRHIHGKGQLDSSCELTPLSQGTKNVVILSCLKSGFTEMGLKFYLQGAITYSLMILKKAVKQRQKLQNKRKGAFNFRHLRNTEAAP